MNFPFYLKNTVFEICAFLFLLFVKHLSQGEAVMERRKTKNIENFCNLLTLI